MMLVAATVGVLLGVWVSPVWGATITVGTTAEDPSASDPACSLREAIIAANRAMARGGCAAGDAGAANTIVLAAGATYMLTMPDQPETGKIDRASWYGPDGLPPIASDITIEGNGATIARSSSAPANFRLFFVGANPADTVNTPSYTSPGAGRLTLRNVTLTGGVAKGGDSNDGGGGAGMGGAIFSQGTVVIDHSTLTANTARGGSAGNSAVGNGGGGIGTDAPVPPFNPGGGFGAGNFGGGTGGTGGTGNGGGGGAGFRTTENGNPGTAGTAGAGGGPASGLGGSGGNVPSANGGDGSGGGGTGTFGSGSTGGGFGQGGLEDSRGGGGGGVGAGGGAGGFGGTDGGGGGGGFGGGGGGNEQAGNGGNGGFGGGGGRKGAPGFGGGSPTTSASGGGAGMGGAIFNMQGTLTITDSTLTGNSAIGGTDNVTDHGKGIAGAVFNLNGTVTATGSTIAVNTAASGTAVNFSSQIYNLEYDGHDKRTAQTTLIDTIVANGHGSVYDLASDKSNYNITPPPGASANVDVSQFDLVQTMNQVEPGTIIGTPLATADPLLGVLHDNGGPTQTMALGAGSPAIDRVPAAGGGCLPTDQRGVARPQPPGGMCDIGAYEYALPTCQAVAASTGVGQAVVVQLQCTDPAGAPLTYAIDTNPAHGSLGSLQPATGRVTYTPNTGYNGTDSFTYHASSANGTAATQTASITVTLSAITVIVPAALSGLRVSPRKFSLAGRKVKGRCIKPTAKSDSNKHCRRKVKLDVSYTLTSPATVIFTIERKAPGRKVVGRCVKPNKKNNKHKHCTRLLAIHGTITRASTAGANSFTFNGKIGGHKLGPGTYQLTATPTGGTPQPVTFKLVP